MANLNKEELHWQYAEGWNSISVLLEHICACSHYFRIIFLENRKLTPEEALIIDPGLFMGEYIPQLISKNKDLEYYLGNLSTSSALMNEAISKLSEADFMKNIAAYNPITGTNLAWVLYHVVEDEVHHRGQISMIRKLYKSN